MSVGPIQVKSLLILFHPCHQIRSQYPPPSTGHAHLGSPPPQVQASWHNPDVRNVLNSRQGYDASLCLNAVIPGNVQPQVSFCQPHTLATSTRYVYKLNVRLSKSPHTRAIHHSIPVRCSYIQSPLLRLKRLPSLLATAKPLSATPQIQPCTPPSLLPRSLQLPV